MVHVLHVLHVLPVLPLHSIVPARLQAWARAWARARARDKARARDTSCLEQGGDQEYGLITVCTLGWSWSDHHCTLYCRMVIRSPDTLPASDHHMREVRHQTIAHLSKLAKRGNFITCH